MKKMSNFRWVICAMLFFATTVNYLDRQVLSLTWKDFIAPEFGWTDANYGTITAFFSIFYACVSLVAGKAIDWLGTRKGYLWAIFFWSLAACLHAACGVATMALCGYESLGAMGAAVKAGGQAGLAVATTSVWLFLACRAMLALGESGNFPAAIKVTAEYNPKKDRALSTAVFNAGASVGALASPVVIPLLARHFRDAGVGGGWEMAFVIIGALGFVWMGFWLWLYRKPAESPYVNAAELAYIEDGDAEGREAGASGARGGAGAGKPIGFFRCFAFRQTWSFVAGKFFTDGVWWFFLFWTPAYFKDQFGLASDNPKTMALVATLYTLVTAVSIAGGYLPKLFVEKFGMEAYSGRMRAMLVFAFFPIAALFAQPLGPVSPWFPAILIGLVGAGHQSWSANIYSTVSDMFPKSTVATVTGVGTMAGGIGAFLINKSSGILFTYAEGRGAAFRFLGFEGKPAGYMIVFCVCAVAYLAAWGVMKALVPSYRRVEA